MKKLLFCAAVVALATACTNEDDFAMNQSDSRTQGLTFNVDLAEGAATRGEIWENENGTYPFFWYAEDDRINVFATNVTKPGAAVGTNGVAGDWTGLGAKTAASYKATVSSGKGQFTAANDNEMLLLADYDANNEATTVATIVATYGKDIKVNEVVQKEDGGVKVPGELTKLVLTTTADNKTQSVARANAVVAPMYSVSTAMKEEAYNSFGEQANLEMIRPFPVVRFTTKNTEDYIEDFGKLKSVEMTALGVLDSDGNVVPAGKKSDLAYENGATYTIENGEATFTNGVGSGLEAVKVEFDGGGTAWSDNDAVYMTVAPTNRKELFKGKKEALKVVYTFENIEFVLDPSRGKDATDFEKAYQTSNEWTAVSASGKPNAITVMPALDINNYNYLVTDDNGGNVTLIVIKGSFSDVFDKSDKASIAWNAGVPVSSITKIISKVKLEEGELAAIKEFSGLEKLTLAENTEIPAGTFTTAQAAQIESLNLPKVASIDKKFATETNAAFNALTELILPSYEFTDNDVNGIILTPAKSTLKTLDMSGVRSMMPMFGIDRSISFKDYTALETVTVQDGLIVASNGFAGCTNLTTIKGKIDISDASGAFAMSTNNSKLKSVEVTGTVIRDAAFQNCKVLETIKYNGANLAPTVIEANAFNGATKIEYMDLSKATTIGASAFLDSGLKSAVKGNDILTVGAKTLTESAFENTHIKIVKFTNATEIAGNKVLNGITGLKQVKFEKIFKLADLAKNSTDNYNEVFGGVTAEAGIDFWTNPEQEGVSGNKLTLTYKVGTDSNSKTYTFNTIQRRLD